MRLDYELPDDAEISIRDEVDGQHLEIASGGAELSIKLAWEHMQQLASLLREYGYPFDEDRQPEEAS